MNLSMLTTGGWIWLWFTLSVTIDFLVTALGHTSPQLRRDRVQGAFAIAAMLTWTLWLVTP